MKNQLAGTRTAYHFVTAKELFDYEFQSFLDRFDLYHSSTQILKKQMGRTRIRVLHEYDGKPMPPSSPYVRGYCQVLFSTWHAWPLFADFEDHRTASVFLLALRNSRVSPDGLNLTWDRDQAINTLYHAIPAVVIAARRLKLPPPDVFPLMQRLNQFVHNAPTTWSLVKGSQWSRKIETISHSKNR